MSGQLSGPQRVDGKKSPNLWRKAVTGGGNRTARWNRRRGARLREAWVRHPEVMGEHPEAVGEHPETKKGAPGSLQGRPQAGVRPVSRP